MDGVRALTIFLWIAKARHVHQGGCHFSRLPLQAKFMMVCPIANWVSAA